MRFLKHLILGLVALGMLACETVAPTPILIHKLVNSNDEVKHLFLECSVGANYVPDKPGCKPEELKAKSITTMDLAKEFISADIHQPQGYDIYLSVAMIYFRVAQITTNDYSDAEKIARQFFEIQKASSGLALNDARFYWAAICSAHASWQWFNARDALTTERKADLLLCFAEGNIAFNAFPPGPRKTRLADYIVVLKSITDVLP